MATRPDFIDYIREQADLGDRLVAKKMFGEYAIYLDGKVIALACDNSLFVKPTAIASPLAAGLEMRPPYPGAKPHLLADALLDNADRLKGLLLATATALPTRSPVGQVTPKRRRRPAPDPE